MALEIIGAGFGRTGTYSLKAALELLGFGPCHHMSEVVPDPQQIRAWAQVADGHPDFDRIFSGFRSAVDFPVSAYWPEVLNANPDARIILSYRDPEDWYGSFSQTILPLVLDREAWPQNAVPWFEMMEKVIVGKALRGRTDRDGILKAYRDNEAAVRDLDAQGTALVFSVGDGWAPLCRFLDVAAPETPFPKTNRRADFFASVKSGTQEPAA